MMGVFFVAPLAGGFLVGLLNNPIRGSLASNLLVAFSVSLAINMSEARPRDPLFAPFGYFAALTGFFFVLLVGGACVGWAFQYLQKRRIQGRRYDTHDAQRAQDQGSPSSSY